VATIDNVPLDIAVVLGTTSMPVHQVLRLGRGAIIEVDASEDDEVTILANNLPVPSAPWWSMPTGPPSRSGKPAAFARNALSPCTLMIDLLHPAVGRLAIGRAAVHPILRSWRNW
jgi:hypothetical protein